MNIVDVGGALFFASSATALPPDDAADDTGSAATVESSSPPPDSASQAAPKRAYPAPAEIPTQEGPKGIRFDFNDGCRVMLPEGEHPWKVRLSDIDTGNILFETEIRAGRVNSTKRYFVRVRLEVWANGESVLSHDYSAAGREVLIQLPVGTLGDPMGWFPYAVKFKELHGCRLTCLMSDKLIPLFRDAYPDIALATEEEVKPEVSFCLSMLNNNVLGYFSALHPDHGVPVYQEMEFLATDGASLGDIIKHTYDGVILANGGVLVEKFVKSKQYGGTEELRFRIELK